MGAAPDGTPPLLRPETVATAHAAAPATEGRYGLGHERWPGIEAVGHAGSNWGWRSMLMMRPGQRQAVVVLTNSDEGLPFVREITCYWGAWVTGLERAAICPDA